MEMGIVNSKKSILLLAPEPFFVRRGTPFNVRAMLKVLARAGYDVHLLCYPIGEDISINGVTIHRCAKIPGLASVPIGPSWCKIAYDIPFFFSAIWLTFLRRFDVIHGVEEAGIIAGLISFFNRVPYVFDMDSSMPEQLEKSGFIKSSPLLKFVSKIEGFFLRRARAILTVCEALSDKAKIQAANIPIYQIEDFPVEDADKVDVSLLKKLKEQYRKDSRKILLYTGNLESYQGIDLLLDSCALLKQQTKEFLLLIVGGSVEQVDHYSTKCKELNIADKVVFIGQRPTQEMGTFMALADVLVSPRSEGENTPLKLYSYMAADRAIVASSIRTHTQVLDEQSAFLAKPEKEPFSKALISALEDSDLARRKAKKALQLVETRYSFKQFSENLERLYRDILDVEAVQTKDVQAVAVR